MPSFSSSLQLLIQHVWLGVAAAVLFVAGLATAVPVTRHNVHWLMALPLWVVREVLRIIGPSFPPLRVFLVIFAFNTVAIFLYMLSGVLVFVPAAVAFLTGVNIGVILLKAGEVEVPTGQRPLAAALEPHEDQGAAPWVSLCSLAVLVLELPSFWISVGMGIGMGRRLSEPGQYTLENLGTLAYERVQAYWMIIIPLLFLSALAETAAVCGHIRAGTTGPAGPRDDDEARKGE